MICNFNSVVLPAPDASCPRWSDKKMAIAALHKSLTGLMVLAISEPTCPQALEAFYEHLQSRTSRQLL